jgi:mycolic acid cyclopropane synthetase
MWHPEAQVNKFDLVARKLGLRAGMRLLDVGCGWGGMVMHAAREYGVKALGVTLTARPGHRWLVPACSGSFRSTPGVQHPFQRRARRMSREIQYQQRGGESVRQP